MSRRIVRDKRCVQSVSPWQGARVAALFASLILSAYGVALALSTVELPWLGWVTLLPLFVAIRRLTPRAAMLAGGVWGLSLLASTTVLLDTAVSLSPVSAALMLAVPAIYVGLGSRLTRRIGFSPFVLAVGWIAVEFALTPLGLRHGLLAGTQGGGSLVQTVGGFLGYVFVAFIIAYASGMFVAAIGLLRALIVWFITAVDTLDPLGSVIPQSTRLVPIRVPGASRSRAPPLG